MIDSKYIACLIDISYGISDDFLTKCGGKVYLSGFFNDSVNAYCCSITPSVFVGAIELVPESLPEDEESREAIYEELMDAFCEGDCSGYYDRSYIEKMKKEKPERFSEIDIHLDKDESEDDQVREYLQGNPVF